MTDTHNATVPPHRPCYDCRRHLENSMREIMRGTSYGANNTTPPPPHTHTHTHSHTRSPPHTHQQDNAAELSRPVLHDIHMHIFSRTPTCSTCLLYICIPFSVVRRPVLHAGCTYAYLLSRTVTCSTRHTYAYLFQPEAEVKEGVAGVCERCVRCSYPQVFTVQQHVQMSVCVHPHPDTTARSDII